MELDGSAKLTGLQFGLLMKALATYCSNSMQQVCAKAIFISMILAVSNNFLSEV